jgi:carboxyl-terminal processing protease
MKVSFSPFSYFRDEYPMSSRFNRYYPLRSKLLPATLVLFSVIAASSSALQAKINEPISYSKEQVKTSKEIIKRLESRHYSTLKLNDNLSSRLLDNYLDKLDGSRSFLLQEDLASFEKYRYKLDDNLKAGKLDAGFLIFNRYQQRLTERLQDIVDNLPTLIANMDFERDEDITLDRSEAPWPANKAEADDIWRKLIKSRIISLRLAGKAEDEIEPLLLKRYQNQLNRVQQSNSEDAFQIYMNALTNLYDPHTSYLSPATSDNFNINMSLSLEGIGAVLQSEDEYTKVVRLVHAGPADKQGQLQPSDRIVAVAQEDGVFQDVVGLRLDEVVQLIRGPKDSKVQLEVIPVSAKTDEERKIIQIVRNTVKLEEQSAQKKVLDLYNDDKLYKVGIIDIPAFYIDFDAMRRCDPNYKSTTRDVSKLLMELIEEDVDGIIIDLRENGGGSLQEANQLTGLFIDSGPTVQIRNSDTQTFRDGKRQSSPYYGGPLAILINRLSASASEIFAGAIQDYQRGIVIGSPSFGKGTVQSLSPLNHGQLKITESKFYRISGESTQHRGVIPDIEFPALYDQEKVGESSLDNALAWDTIAPVPHPQYFNLQAIIPQLEQKHQVRMKQDPDFVFLQDQLALIEQARTINTLPLNEIARKAYQEQEKEKSLTIENKRRLAKGMPALSSLDEIDVPTLENNADASEEISSADTDDLANKDEDDDEVDALLTESGKILIDSISVFQRTSLAAKR